MTHIAMQCHASSKLIIVVFGVAFFGATLIGRGSYWALFRRLRQAKPAAPTLPSVHNKRLAGSGTSLQ